MQSDGIWLIFLIIILIIAALVVWVWYYMRKNPQPTTSNNVNYPEFFMTHRKVTVLTAHGNNKEHIQYTHKINKAYSSGNNYVYKEIVYEEPMYKDRSFSWNKIYALYEELQVDNDTEYILWIDDDAAFVNFDLNLSPLIYISNGAPFVFARNMTPNFPVDTGVFLIKKHDNYVKTLLNRLHNGKSLEKYFKMDSGEQEALIDIIVKPEIPLTNELFNGGYSKTLEAGYPIVKRNFCIFSENNFNSHGNHFIKHLSGMSDDVKTKIFKHLSQNLDNFGLYQLTCPNTVWNSTHCILSSKRPKHDSRVTVSQIPHILNQNFEHLLLPSAIAGCVQHMLIINHDMDYNVHTTRDNEIFIENNYDPIYLKCFKELIPGAYKSDFWRYLYLYREGGFYSDIKTYPISGFTSLLNKNITMILVQDINGNGYWNAFMACTPGHRLMKACYEKSKNNIISRSYGDGTLDITGPNIVGRCVKKLYGSLKVGYNETEDGIILVLNRNYENVWVHKIFMPESQEVLMLARKPGYHGPSDREDMYLATSRQHYDELYKRKKVFLNTPNEKDD